MTKVRALCLSGALFTVLPCAQGSEKDELALVMKQLDQLQASLERAKVVAVQEHTSHRFYFDYPQATDDIAKIKRGISTYLEPSALSRYCRRISAASTNARGSNDPRTGAGVSRLDQQRRPESPQSAVYRHAGRRAVSVGRVCLCHRLSRLGSRERVGKDRPVVCHSRRRPVGGQPVFICKLMRRNNMNALFYAPGRRSVPHWF